MRLFAFILALTLFVLTSCIRLQPRPHTLGTSAPPGVCDKLARQVLGFNIASVAAGVLNGGATLAGTLWNNTLGRYLLGGGAILLGGIGASLGYAATFYAALYHRSCP